MMALLTLKSKLKNFYEKHYRVARGSVKACLVFAILFVTTFHLDYSDLLGQYIVLAVISIICGVTADFVSLLAIAIVALGEIYRVSPLASVAITILLIIYYLLFGRLTEKQGIVLVAIRCFPRFSLDIWYLLWLPCFFSGHYSGVGYGNFISFSDRRNTGICSRYVEAGAGGVTDCFTRISVRIFAG